MRELCLANLTLADAGPLALVDAAASAGFASVNMWLTPPPAVGLFGAHRDGQPPLVGDRAAIAELRSRLDDTGVRLFEGSAGWIAPGFTPAQIDAVLETLAALDARAVALVGWDPDRSRLVEHLHAICEAAQGYGLRIHLEFMPYSAVRTLADGLAVLDAAAQPNAALIVDALHLARSGGDAKDLRRVDPRRLASVQLCDAPLAPPSDGDLRRESVTTRRLPGDGELPLRALLDVLPGDVVIEAEVPIADASEDIGGRARRVGDALRRFVYQG